MNILHTIEKKLHAMRIQIVFALAVLSAYVVSAQPKWEIGLTGGASFYLGDLAPSEWPVWSETKPMAGVQFGYRLSPGWSLRLGLSGSKITGDDNNFPEDNWVRLYRKATFETTMGEAALAFIWEPWGRKRITEGNVLRRIWSPYLFTGFGRLQGKVEPDFSNIVDDGLLPQARRDQKAKLNRGFWTMPVGVGLRKDLGRNSFLNAEFGVRTAFSDHLDGVSFAGNPNDKDWYAFAGLALGWRLGRWDVDGDGILDKDDKCPRVPGKASAQGCPDADGDGVEDLEDACPEVAGLIEQSGCPDTDRDGTMDLLDACPTDPGPEATQGCPDADSDNIADKDDECPELAGLEAFKGCPDTDGDGIPDKDDECPDVSGFEQFKGCPFADADKDGIADEDDRCPDIAGTEAFKGCPDTDGDGVADPDDRCPELAGELGGCPDADKDGVADIDDHCPETAGEKDNGGCPPLPEEKRKVLDLATKAVQFETAKAALKKASLKTLSEIADILKEYDYYHLSIEGHTDSQGSDKLNQGLSEKRAQACYDYLVKQGIAAERLKHAGFGETMPVATNKTAAGRQLNRRVEFKLSIE